MGRFLYFAAMQLLTLGGLALSAIPRLETPDLILRGPRPDDLPAAAALHLEPAFYRYLGNNPNDEETVWRRMLSHAGHWALLGYGSWAIEEKATGQFVGTTGFFDVQRDLTPSLKGTPEAGWVLDPRLHGRGYASQAVGAAVAWADEHLPSPRTACIIDPDNEASLRLAAKFGYREYARSPYHGAEIVLLERPRGGR
jgi:RimJ/RimL family protein N-acetyltransferase